MSSEPVPPHRLTYTQDIAPILFKHCSGCHRPDGTAPFSLLTYDQVKNRGQRIAAVTAGRVMPPFLPEPGLVRFEGERRLTRDEIDKVQAWAQQGMIEGDIANLPPLPRFSEGWQFGEPDLVLKLPQPYTLAAGHEDTWRNFVIPVPIARTEFVKTVELHPGAANIVHHAMIAVDDLRSSRHHDEQDAEPGFAGMDMGDAHMPEGNLLGWTPGMLPYPGVDGSAWALRPGTDLILQLHLMPAGRPVVVDPVIGLHYSDAREVGHPLYVLMLDADEQIDIPAGADHFVVSDELELPVDAEALAVYPHAHYVGRKLEATALRSDGSALPLIHINEWNFKWQDVYRFAAPVPLSRGTVLRMRWTYDNSSGNTRQMNHPPKRVVNGNRSADEMAHLQIQLRLRSTRDRLLLQEAYFRHLLRKNSRSARFRYGLAGVLKDMGRFADAASEYRAALEFDPRYADAHLNLGSVLMEQGRVGEATRHLLEAIRLSPRSHGAHYNLAFVYGLQGRLADAARQYREALVLQPDFGEAHNNLAQILMAEGDVDGAVAHYRDAERLLPDSREVQANLRSARAVQDSLRSARQRNR